jgi:hypothetical protein
METVTDPVTQTSLSSSLMNKEITERTETAIESLVTNPSPSATTSSISSLPQSTILSGENG